MQQLVVHPKLYHIRQIDETEYSKKALNRLNKINNFNQLKKEECSIESACKAVEVPRSTLYRWKWWQ